MLYTALHDLLHRAVRSPMRVHSLPLTCLHAGSPLNLQSLQHEIKAEPSPKEERKFPWACKVASFCSNLTIAVTFVGNKRT
jgi:hypothetical protein